MTAHQYRRPDSGLRQSRPGPLANVVVSVGFAMYGIKWRADLFKAMKDLEAELECPS
ncbi:MAG TPA: hypothetical protein VNS34_23730 [Rhizobiaceae bacterium]|nr:hypothetical protein [Rhizobiaceae bacterium]